MGMNIKKIKKFTNPVHNKENKTMKYFAMYLTFKFIYDLQY